MSKLALCGGEPVRKKQFPDWPLIGQEEIDAVVKVLKSRRLSSFAASPGKHFLGGEKVREFEKNFADYHGMKYAIAVNSATAGLHCALAACGVFQGKEVITTPYTFTATASSILMHNGLPVFADVDPKTYCVSPEAIEKNITEYTQAIVPVHLLGNMAAMDKILEIAKKHNLKIIEDCAQSPGAKFDGKLAGTMGDLGVFSFQETKNMAVGEGGMIITNDERLAHVCRLIRNHGEAVVEGKSRTYLSNIVGWNYRMTEMEAAIGVEQLKKLDKFNAERKKLSEYLTKGISKFDAINPPYIDPRVESVYHVYGMIFDEEKAGISRDIFIKAVQAEGIPIGGGYPHPLYMNPLFQNKIAYGDDGFPFTAHKRNISYAAGICPVAEELCKHKALWLFVNRPPATEEDMQDVIDAFEKVFDNLGELKENGK